MAPSIAETVCLEKRLLICCARVRVQAGIAENIRRLAGGPLDWDYLFSAARDNALLPLLCVNLNAYATEQVPAPRMDWLKAAALKNAAHSLSLTAELITIVGALGAREVSAIPYKGPVLAAQAYGDVALREFQDLDIIVRHADLPRAHEVMLGLGYRPKFPWIHSSGVSPSLVPGDYIYLDENREMMVELHTQRSMRHFPLPPDVDGLMQRLVSVSVSGHEIKSFSVEDGLAILCVHGSKHFWEKLSWIVDISEMIQSHPNLDWNETFRSAERFHGQRMLRVGLALAAGLFDAPLPEEISARVGDDRVAVEMAAVIEQRLLSRDVLPLQTGERLGLRRRMVPGTFAGWRYAFRLATAPTEEDWEMARLPGALAGLYVALRPIRLLLKYGGSGKEEPHR